METTCAATCLPHVFSGSCLTCFCHPPLGSGPGTRAKSGIKGTGKQKSREFGSGDTQIICRVKSLQEQVEYAYMHAVAGTTMLL